MSEKILSSLCGMIKINENFGQASLSYFEEMHELFGIIPVVEHDNSAPELIRNLKNVNDSENSKYNEEDILSSTNIGSDHYFKSKRSVTHNE